MWICRDDGRWSRLCSLNERFPPFCPNPCHLLDLVEVCMGQYAIVEVSDYQTAIVESSSTDDGLARFCISFMDSIASSVEF